MKKSLGREDMTPYIFFIVFFVFLSFPLSIFAANTSWISQAETKARVIKTFKDDPILINIAKCESRFRQYHADGTVLNGGLGNGMVGVMQIYGKIHRATAEKLGYDIRTLKGNLGYAQYLYERQGTSPWLDSAHCWREMEIMDTSEVADVEESRKTAEPAFTTDLSLHDENLQVRALQKTLNTNGFAVSSSGVGSSGEETRYFGRQTLAAVQDFQCEQDVACAGDPGYGRVGPKTRAALNILAAKSDSSKHASQTETQLLGKEIVKVKTKLEEVVERFEDF